MRQVRNLAMLAGVAMAALAGSAAAQDYTIGISNTVQGNGWREEMICAMKAQALASGKVEVAEHRPPQHRRRRSARGHPQSDRRRRQRHRRQPGRPGGHQSGDQGSDGRRHRRRRGRPGRHRAVGLRHLEQPGRIRLSRREMAVRADRRQGRRRLHARRRRRIGRQRSRQGLQARARRVPGREGRA